MSALNKQGYFAVVAIVFLFASCKKETTNSTGPIILHQIGGGVSLYSEAALAVSDSGMLVSIIGSNPLLFDMTNDDGNFNIQEVPSGTYNLQFEKTGFGTFKIFDVDHTAGAPTYIPVNPSLSERSSTSISAVVTTISNDSLNVNTTLDQPASNNNPRYVRVFFGKNSDLSPEKNDSYTGVIERKINPFDIRFSKAELEAMGFVTGETVYVNVAGDSFFGNDYFDPDLGRQVFPNLLWTNGGDSFVMP